MTAAAFALLIAFLAAGLFLSRRRAFPLALAGAVLALACFSAAAFRDTAPPLSSFRLSLGTAEFLRPLPARGEVEEYSLTLAVGTLGPSGERWRFSPLGRLKSWRPAQDIPAPLASDRPARIWRRGCSRTFDLPAFHLRFSIGWDSEGGEFLRAEPVGRLHRYIRPYNSYDGVFPGPGEDFAAVRLFISGQIRRGSGGAFGLPSGTAAFLVVQPVLPGETLELDASSLFTELRCTATPYRFSNDVTSFEAARELLMRGTCFPRHGEGVPALLSDASPVLLLFCLAAGLGLFAAWRRFPGVGLVLAVFVALLALSVGSRRCFDSIADAVRTGGEHAAYACAALAAQPLWTDSARAVLERAADSAEPESARWASFVLSLSFGEKKLPLTSNQRKKAPENLPSPHNGKN